MIAIVFKNKNLLVKQDTEIYQNENLIDNLKILIPKEYNGHLLRDFNVYLQYENVTNNVKNIKLKLTEEMYKDMMIYTLPVDNELTYSASKLKICLKFRKTEKKGNQILEYRMNSSYACLNILKSSDYMDYKLDDSNNETNCDLESHYIIEF